jgi:hypothetical protein
VTATIDHALLAGMVAMAGITFPSREVARGIEGAVGMRTWVSTFYRCFLTHFFLHAGGSSERVDFFSFDCLVLLPSEVVRAYLSLVGFGVDDNALCGLTVCI